MNLNAEIRLPAGIERKLARLAFGSKTRERCWRKLATHQRHRMPIDESLRLFAKQARAAGSLSAQCYTLMRDRLSAGKNMRETLAGLATPEEILLIHSSQIGGKLPEGLLLAADLLAAKRKVIGAVIGAVAYPAFLFALVVVVLYAMSVVIIPQLTAITDPCDVAALHLLDCAYLLTAADFRGKSVVDVGTGAGFPGMPLRILEPNFDLTLLDSLGKRVDFLRETADAMGLRRVRCVHARAEEFARKHREQFDIATSRAVAQLNVLCELTLPLVKVGGVFLAMKSVESDPELQEARSAIAQLGGAVEDVTDYTIPGTEVTHRVVRIRKERPTPAGFPRAFARIKKAPLR